MVNEQRADGPHERGELRFVVVVFVRGLGVLGWRGGMFRLELSNFARLLERACAIEHLALFRRQGAAMKNIRALRDSLLVAADIAVVEQHSFLTEADCRNLLGGFRRQL